MGDVEGGEGGGGGRWEVVDVEEGIERVGREGVYRC